MHVQSTILTDAEIALLNVLPQAVLLCDLAGDILFANPSTDRLLTYGTAPFTRSTLYNSAREWVRQISAGASPMDVEWHFNCADHTPLTLCVSTTFLRNSDGTTRGILLTLVDISISKRAEAGEQEQRRLAESLRDTVAELTRTLDLKAVLNAILQNVGRLVPHCAVNIVLIEGSQGRFALYKGYPSSVSELMKTFVLPLDLATMKQMMTTGAPCHIPDVWADPNWQILPGLEWVRSYLGVPIRAYEHVIGFLNLDFDQPNAFTPLQIESLQAFADQAAIAIENAQLYEAIYRDASEMRALNRAMSFVLSSSPLSTDTVNDVAQRIAETVVKEFDKVDCGVILLIPPHHHLKCITRVGKIGVGTGTVMSLDGDGIIQTAFRSKKPIYAPEVVVSQCNDPHPHRVGSQLVVPLESINGVIGVIDLQSEQVDAFTREDQQLLAAFARHAAVAIDNARLYHEIQQYAEKLEEKVNDRTNHLNRVKQRVEAILNNSSDAILLLDVDGTIRQSNRAFNLMFEYGRDELYNTNFTTCATPECVDTLSATLTEVVQYGEPGRVEIMARRHGGAAFDADVMISPIRTVSDDLTGLVCSLRDVSAYKQMERDLRTALAQQRELNNLRVRFITRVSHEFRTPLAMIQTASDLLVNYGMKMTPEQTAEKLQTIQEGTRRLTEILERVERGSSQMYFSPTSIDLEAMARTVIAKEVQGGAQQNIIFSKDGLCSEVLVDADLMRQIMENLLSNAVKYSPAGSQIQFTLSCLPAKTVIYIQDEGIGIPEEDQQYLFQMFLRASNVDEIDGTGLGLAIVKQAVELHGGEITFESHLGKGTSFTVAIPHVSGEAKRDEESTGH